MPLFNRILLIRQEKRQYRIFFLKRGIHFIIYSMNLLGGRVFESKTKVTIGNDVLGLGCIDLILLNNIFSNKLAYAGNKPIGRYGEIPFFGLFGLSIRIIMKNLQINGGTYL